MGLTREALHLEAAMRVDAAAIHTYDHRLCEAARSAGLDVVRPARRTRAEPDGPIRGDVVDFKFNV